jgi:hypothetical protein
MNGTIFSTHWKWQKVFSYGEVICFVTAWAIGLVVARDRSPSVERPAAVRSIAATSDQPDVAIRR